MALFAIGFSFKNWQTQKLLIPKIGTSGSFYLIAISFLKFQDKFIAKTISHVKFERLLVTDFCSNDFSEISLAFTRRDFL